MKRGDKFRAYAIKPVNFIGEAIPPRPAYNMVLTVKRAGKDSHGPYVEAVELDVKLPYSRFTFEAA